MESGNSSGDSGKPRQFFVIIPDTLPQSRDEGLTARTGIAEPLGMKALRIILFVLALSAWTVNTGHAQGLTRVTVYVQNPTSVTLNFLYRMGGDDWRKHYIQSGHTLTMTGIADHYIRFDNGRGRTIQYRLTPGSTNYFSWSKGILYFQHR